MRNGRNEGELEADGMHGRADAPAACKDEAMEQPAEPKAKAKAKRKAKAKAKAEAKPKATPKKRGRKVVKADPEEPARKTPERRTLFADEEEADKQGGEADGGVDQASPGRAKIPLSPMAKNMAQKSSPKAKAKAKGKARAKGKAQKQDPLAHLLYEDSVMGGVFRQAFRTAEGLPFDDLKTHLVGKKQAFNKCMLNCYWSRACCGVKSIMEPSTPEVAYFAYKGGSFNARLAAAYMSALLMAFRPFFCDVTLSLND